MKSPRQLYLKHLADIMPQLNVRNLKLFAHRIAVEIDTMRGRIFDETRDALYNQNSDGSERKYIDPRADKLSRACNALYRAHVALLEAQAELSK